ncbi:hypothetical protein S40288_01602, partial [Stachybotrys chartarum IBT 40288]
NVRPFAFISLCGAVGPREHVFWLSLSSCVSQASLPDRSMSEAIAVEQAAYEDASSLDEYTRLTTAKPHSQSLPQATPSSTPTGIHIGSFTDCVPIASGLTSDVFHHPPSRQALKVITATHSIAPHNPRREAKLLADLKSPCVISLLDVFWDQHQRMVLVFLYMPLTLGMVLEQSVKERLSMAFVRGVFGHVLRGLDYLHQQGIVHRDIKPSAILLQSRDGPACIADFGTAWSPTLSTDEPASSKILDIGTGPYRAPEVLFGHTGYGCAVDMWAVGVMLAEAVTFPPKPLFESRPAHEDGSQLGLILSIFKTLGTPTEETWPEAKEFKVRPFELWTIFPRKTWEEILPDVDEGARELVAALLRFDGSRASAKQARATNYRHKIVANLIAGLDIQISYAKKRRAIAISSLGAAVSTFIPASSSPYLHLDNLSDSCTTGTCSGYSSGTTCTGTCGGTSCCTSSTACPASAYQQR